MKREQLENQRRKQHLEVDQQAASAESAAAEAQLSAALAKQEAERAEHEDQEMRLATVTKEVEGSHSSVRRPP